MLDTPGATTPLPSFQILQFATRFRTKEKRQNLPTKTCPKIDVQEIHGEKFQESGTTLPETNIAPENRPSQKETSIPTIHFQVPC